MARRIFTITGHDPSRVRDVSTEDYFATAQAPFAPRPHNSALDLTKVEATGFEPAFYTDQLADYLSPTPEAS
ncbi:dTDP-4-dehydrorhamnose reductase family protein [Mycolicibacterium phocaicum]|uniref:sugar nucleotide-binding protein n=1 Tax=Mycolicibacterium phocaicum TaxID=319706 RepID=UPI002286A0D8|nr:sugar nucleotide-binding protein [Mycolicibacterium phocaicum]